MKSQIIDTHTTTARPRATDGARVIQVIETRAIAGLGVEQDPVREVLQYWDFDGNLLAIHDPYRRNAE